MSKATGFAKEAQARRTGGWGEAGGGHASSSTCFGSDHKRFENDSMHACKYLHPVLNCAKQRKQGLTI